MLPIFFRHLNNLPPSLSASVLMLNFVISSVDFGSCYLAVALAESELVMVSIDNTPSVIL